MDNDPRAFQFYPRWVSGMLNSMETDHICLSLQSQGTVSLISQCEPPEAYFPLILVEPAKSQLAIKGRNYILALTSHIIHFYICLF